MVSDKMTDCFGRTPQLFAPFRPFRKDSATLRLCILVAAPPTHPIQELSS